MYYKFEQLLSEHNLTAFRVASDTKITPSTFSDWKTGRSKPKMDKLQKLAKYFDVPLEYFVENENTDKEKVND